MVVSHLMLNWVPSGAVYGLGRSGQSTGPVASAVVVGRAVVVSKVVVVSRAVVVSRVMEASVVVTTSVVETMRERVSEMSVSVVDVGRVVVDSPISVDVVIVSRLDVTIEDGRHGPALTPVTPRKATGPARVKSRNIVIRG